MSPYTNQKVAGIAQITKRWRCNLVVIDSKKHQRSPAISFSRSLPESPALSQRQGLHRHRTVGRRVLPTNTKDWRLTLLVRDVYNASSWTLDFLVENCIWAELRLIIHFKHPCFAYEVRTVAMRSRRNKLQSTEYKEPIAARKSSAALPALCPLTNESAITNHISSLAAILPKV